MGRIKARRGRTPLYSWAGWPSPSFGSSSNFIGIRKRSFSSSPCQVRRPSSATSAAWGSCPSFRSLEKQAKRSSSCSCLSRSFMPYRGRPDGSNGLRVSWTGPSGMPVPYEGIYPFPFLEKATVFRDRLPLAFTGGFLRPRVFLSTKLLDVPHRKGTPGGRSPRISSPKVEGSPEEPGRLFHNRSSVLPSGQPVPQEDSSSLIGNSGRRLFRQCSGRPTGSSRLALEGPKARRPGSLLVLRPDDGAGQSSAGPAGEDLASPEKSVPYLTAIGGLGLYRAGSGQKERFFIAHRSRQDLRPARR